MIQPQTVLKVIDNSGAASVRCFNILRKQKRIGYLGDILVGSVRETRQLEENKANAKVQRVTKGQVVHAVVVRSRKETRRPDGTYVRFDDNACVLVDLNDKKKGIMPRGTRVMGCVAEELRRRGMTKILSLSPAVL